jgi:hypothetical protein
MDPLPHPIMQASEPLSNITNAAPGASKKNRKKKNKKNKKKQAQAAPAEIPPQDTEAVVEEAKDEDDVARELGLIPLAPEPVADSEPATISAPIWE